MSEALSALRVPIDPERGGVLLANMLASWLDHDRSLTATAEAGNESEDSRTTPQQASLHLPAPVDAGPSSPPSGEYRAPVCLAREGAGTGLERRTLDQDLGKTGTEMTRREDFKTLVADVSMGQVGAVFALEVSRLARSNLDWQRLLELCAFTSTLVIDEDGCYDPADFNDGLLLGLKGVMASAELHFLRARLQGGKLHKAQKGELRFPLPVGFCYDVESRIILDPDEEVRGAVSLETGRAARR